MTIRFHISLVVALLCTLTATSQLVNAGFESCSSFPLNTGQWQVVDGWNNAGSLVASPDYYHYNGSTAADIPETPLALVEAYEGNAIMGLIACGRQHTNLREYVTAIFSEPLEVGRTYLISFKITNGIKTTFSTAGLAVSDLGLFFSTSQPSQVAETPLNVTPQLKINDVFYSADWERINFVFEADQPYLYMTFGLFGDDSDKVITIAEGDDPVYAYYFLDDFSLVPAPLPNDPNIDPIERENPTKPVGDISSPEPFFVPNTFTPNGDQVNDVFVPVANQVKEWELAVYNNWGERVFFTANENQGWDGWYNSKLAEAGAYVWEIYYTEVDPELGLVRKEMRGVVTLLR